MLTIRISNQQHPDGTEIISWHIGKALPEFNEPIIDIQVDGDELDFIFMREPELVAGKGMVQRFMGKDATRIVDMIRRRKIED